MKKLLLFLLLSVFMLPSFAQYSNHQFDWQNVLRKYILYIPANYNASQPTPFVLALHGLGDTNTNFKGINMNLVADTANFIIAFPQALVDTVLTGSSAWNAGVGQFGVTLNPDVDDVGFLNALIDSVSASYNIDQTRIYSTGFSMGGFMTNRLGCELNSRIAAIVSVSGTIGSGITCTPSRAVPACHFHGTADQTISYAADPYGLNAEPLVNYWIQHDNCDTTPASIDTIHNSTKPIVHYKWHNGSYGSEVEFYKVINGVHEWISNANINYSVEIWRFFRRFQWAPQTSGVSELTNSFSLEVYPNPSTGILTIKTDELKPSWISVYDLTGKKVKELGYNSEIDAHELSPGIYFLEIKAGQQVARKRFIKM